MQLYFSSLCMLCLFSSGFFRAKVDQTEAGDVVSCDKLRQMLFLI